jgi:hypothetical protein
MIEPGYFVCHVGNFLHAFAPEDVKPLLMCGFEGARHESHCIVLYYLIDTD